MTPAGQAAGAATAAVDAARVWKLDPARLEPVASVYRPAAAFRCGDVLLKPYRYPERQLYYAARALVHLAGQAFAGAPRLVPTPGGEPYANVAGQLWYATTWIEGRPPRFPADLPAAALALATFHRASQGCFIPWSISRSWPRRWEGLLADLHAFRRMAEAGATPFDRSYARTAPAFIRQAAEALAELQRSGYHRLEEEARRRPSFCHRDLTGANLVVTPDGQVCLVDPDTWGADLRLHDLVRLLLAAAGDQPETVQQALDAFGPLLPEERQLLPPALLLPREFWWAGLCRYRRPMPGVEPEQLLHKAITGAPARDACVQALLSEPRA